MKRHSFISQSIPKKHIHTLPTSTAAHSSQQHGIQQKSTNNARHKLDLLKKPLSKAKGINNHQKDHQKKTSKPLKKLFQKYKNISKRLKTKQENHYKNPLFQKNKTIYNKHY